MQVSNGGVVLATYDVNALGQRVRKMVGGSVTHFIYDEQGRLLGEYDGSGTIIEETVWMDDLPVAILRPFVGVTPLTINNVYVHADHLGKPARGNPGERQCAALDLGQRRSFRRQSREPESRRVCQLQLPAARASPDSITTPRQGCTTTTSGTTIRQWGGSPRVIRLDYWEGSIPTCMPMLRLR